MGRTGDDRRRVDEHKKQLWPTETMNRLEADVKARGLTVFARIDHAAGAAAVALTLRPTELLIFGNARVERR